MTKLKMLGIVFFVMALMIGGCGNKVHNTDKKITNTTSTDEKTGDTLEYADGYGFTKFRLKIDAGAKTDVKVDYEMKTKKVEAVYVNRAKKINIKGDEAMEEIHKIFAEIELTKDLSQQEVIDKVLKAVGVDNFTKFKLQIDYDDGTKLEFEESL